MNDDVEFVSLVESLRGPFIAKNLSLDWLEGKECLDIGCGGGFYCVALAFFSGGRTVGVDINGGAIAEARRRFERVENLEFAAANVERLPFHDSSFDFVFCVRVMHHIPNQEKAMSEIGRVSRSGGLLCIGGALLEAP